MTTTLCYSRNRCTNVEIVDDQTLIATCTLQDSLTEAFVRITVKLPELEIVQADGKFTRTHRAKDTDVTAALDKIAGVRIGAGMKKIIRGLVGEVTDCQALPVLVEEACHGVILAFTKDMLALVPKEAEQEKEFFTRMVKENIRLYNRCAAFAPGSPLVEGINDAEVSAD
jgi:hypothetical protein